MTQRWNLTDQTTTQESIVLISETTSQGHNVLNTDVVVKVGGGSDYEKLKNIPTINGVPIVGDYLTGEGLAITDKVISLADKYVRRVRVATKAQWAVEPTYVPDKGQFIVYSDYAPIGGVNYAGIKVGDGSSYIVDLPFIGGDINILLESHINDTASHVSAYDREYWNGKNKVSESVEDEVLMITL